MLEMEEEGGGQGIKGGLVAITLYACAKSSNRKIIGHDCKSVDGSRNVKKTCVKKNYSYLMSTVKRNVRRRIEIGFIHAIKFMIHILYNIVIAFMYYLR